MTVSGQAPALTRAEARAGSRVAAGLAVLVLVGVGSGARLAIASPLVPASGGTASTGRRGCSSACLAARVRRVSRCAGAASARDRRDCGAWYAVAAAVQLAPLGAPLLLSTDAWTYWDYGRIAAVHDGNPYADRPSAFPDDPAFAHMGARWRDKTSVYGPAFTLASEPLARAAGSSREPPAWEYKVLAALAALGAHGLCRVGARRRALAAAFVGWNPLLAIHLAGGGHNDAWVGLLVLGALALGGRSDGRTRPVCSGRSRLPSSGCRSCFSRCGCWRPAGAVSASVRPGSRLTAIVVAGVATWRYGWRWLGALAPLADNARLETRYALPHRLQSAGAPARRCARSRGRGSRRRLVWLARQACSRPAAARSCRMPSARHLAVSRRLVPRLGRAARGGRRGRPARARGASSRSARISCRRRFRSERAHTRRAMERGFPSSRKTTCQR